ncbi:MAG: 30S ribosomal protein S17 [Planctomycetota bacterium]
MPPKTQTKETVARSRRRVVVGVVVGDKMEKTLKVEVERRVRHPEFEKTLRKHYVCYAHDEKREARRGDKVELMETRPLSRLKRWRLVRVLERAAASEPRPAPEAGEAPQA